jgi:hypothetical protein
MSSYTKKNLRDVENQAPNFGMPEEMDARFGRTDLGGETLGLSILKLDPGFVELREWDAIRFDKDTMRNVEAGSDGIEYLAFGAGTDPTDAQMTPGWWSD